MRESADRDIYGESDPSIVDHFTGGSSLVTDRPRPVMNAVVRQRKLPQAASGRIGNNASFDDSCGSWWFIRTGHRCHEEATVEKVTGYSAGSQRWEKR
jgi:hypothetical protein